MKNDRLLWIGGLAAGAAAIVGVGIYMTNKAASATAATAPGNAANAGTYTVIINADGTTNPAAPSPATDQAVQFYLPAGASWADNTATNNAGGSNGLSSIAIPNSGSLPGSAVFSGTMATSNISLNWVDSSGAAHTTNIALT